MTDASNGNGRQPANEARRKEAFKLYCQVGNLAEVARKLGISPGVIYNWSTKYSWKEQRDTVLNRLKHFLDISKLAETNEAARMFIGELNALDHINALIAETMVSEDLRPRTFTEAIRGFDFVMKRKHEILTAIKEAEPTGNGPASPEDQKMIEDLRADRQRKAEADAMENAIGNSRVPGTSP